MLLCANADANSSSRQTTNNLRTGDGRLLGFDLGLLLAQEGIIELIGCLALAKEHVVVRLQLLGEAIVRLGERTCLANLWAERGIDYNDNTSNKSITNHGQCFQVLLLHLLHQICAAYGRRP